MRILHVIDSMRRGGAERMLVDIANRSATAKHDIRVCITRAGSDMASELQAGIAVDVLGRRGRYDPLAPVQFATYLRRVRPDIIHLHARASLPFVALGRLLSRLRVPILLHDHFGGIERDQSIPRYFRASKMAITQYVGVCDELGVWARSAGVPADRVTVIENAIDLSRFTVEPAPTLRDELGPRDRLLGVIVANQHANKGIEVLLDAVAASKQRDKYTIVNVGEAPSSEYSTALAERRERLGISATVKFLGARSDVAQILRAADFAVHTSHTESGPLVLVEYIASGLPFAATCTGSIGRRLRSLGVPGFVQAGQADELAVELDRLVTMSPADRAERARIGRAALPTWDLDVVMPRWHDLYGNLVYTRRRA